MYNFSEFRHMVCRSLFNLVPLALQMLGVFSSNSFLELQESEYSEYI